MARAAGEDERELRLTDRLVSVLAIAVGLGFASAAVMLRPTEAAPPSGFESQAHLAASSVAVSPTDRESFELLTQLALDLRNAELWRDSANAAQQLAPTLDSSAVAFVKAGFLHWYTLDEQQRMSVLTAAAELLRNEHQYRTLWQPVLQTTGDPAFLAEHVPADPSLRRQLRDAAAAWGDFGTYRRMAREFPVESRIRGEFKVLDRPLITRVPPAQSWALRIGSARSLRVEASRDDPIAQPVMVEVWVDGRIREARLVDEPELIRARLGPADEVVEVRVANSRTRGGENRRVAVTVATEH